MTELASTAQPDLSSDPIRVMVVGESENVSGLVNDILESDRSINVVTRAPNGTAAFIRLKRSAVDVVVFDIGMPKTEGIATLPKLFKVEDDIMIVMVSTLTFSNVKLSMKGLLAGAADYLPIPVATRKSDRREKEAAFRRDLLEMVKALGLSRKASAKKRPKPKLEKLDRPLPKDRERIAPRVMPRGPIKLREPSKVQPNVLVFGSSTGGPKALFTVLANLSPAVKQPILITQHMPPTFTTILAQHIAQSSGRKCLEAKDGEEILGGSIYLAPGDYHMVTEAKGSKKRIVLNQDPPVNFCRPAVDPLFVSVANSYGPFALAVILTGMGQDGMLGGLAIADAGGTVIAQDEKSSVVWGMPGAAAEAGICSAVLPVDKLAPEILKHSKV